MANFIAGNNNNIRNVVVGDTIDNRRWVFGTDRNSDDRQIAEALNALAAAGLQTSELAELARNMQRSGGAGRTPQTRAFYEALVRTTALGGEFLKTLPGVKVLVDVLAAFLR